jgi:hypothetical protein
MKDVDLASKYHYGAFGLHKNSESNVQGSLQNLTNLLEYKYAVTVLYYDG